MKTAPSLLGSLLLAGALAACGGGAAAPSSAAPASAAAKPSTAPAASSAAAKPAASAAGAASAKPAASGAASAKPAASGAASAKPAASGAASGSAAAKPAAKPAPSLVPATAVATLKVGSNATLGSILVDGATGKTLYSFAPESDPASKDATKCTGACLGAWPPLLSSDAPTAPAGVTGKLGVITRTDFNVKQVTYNDMPLYFFVQDQAPGDAKGQGVKGFNGNWSVIKTS